VMNIAEKQAVTVLTCFISLIPLFFNLLHIIELIPLCLVLYSVNHDI
jgi:hypothetical protein